MSNKVRLRKIPLSILIQALMDIYNTGVDYIDLIGKNNEEQDTIGIAFCEEYMSREEGEDNEETFDELKEEIKNIKLSDDDLNQLS